jgi:Uma2 family endonuclease
LGRVFFSTGNTAAYVPDVMVFSDGSWSWENGVNAILVEDQYGAQGMATVAQ